MQCCSTVRIFIKADLLEKFDMLKMGLLGHLVAGMVVHMLAWGREVSVMEAIQYIAVAMGLAWASGVNLYATVAVLGIMGSGGHLELPPELQVLSSSNVITVASFMYIVEFFADKIPGVDSVWDAIHSFIRIPAGAILAAGAVGTVSEEAQLVAFLLGGTVAASSHGTKAIVRLTANISPEPVTNWTLSVGEDIAAMVALWAAFNHPYLALAFVSLFFAFSLWLIPRLWGVLKIATGKVRAFFSRSGFTPDR